MRFLGFVFCVFLLVIFITSFPFKKTFYPSEYYQDKIDAMKSYSTLLENEYAACHLELGMERRNSNDEVKVLVLSGMQVDDAVRIVQSVIKSKSQECVWLAEDYQSVMKDINENEEKLASL